MVKEGAIILDVGINRIDDATKKSGSRLVGDVDFDNVGPKSSYITPVPGGSWFNDHLRINEKHFRSRQTTYIVPATLQHTVSYPVMEHFYTLQGEGMHSGKAAYFIRLGGCDVGCVWCDVKDSWDADKHPQMTVEEITNIATAHPGRIAVITGGEPAMHDLTVLCQSLHKAGFKVHIETSGAHTLSGKLDWVTLSPKKFKAPLEENMDKADELKIVVYNKSDFLWAEQYAPKMPKHCKLYLQPEWSRIDKITPVIIDYIKQHPQWQLSLQTHKYINIP